MTITVVTNFPTIERHFLVSDTLCFWAVLSPHLRLLYDFLGDFCSLKKWRVPEIRSAL